MPRGWASPQAISAPLLSPVTRRRQQGQGDGIDDADDQGALGLGPVSQFIDLLQDAEKVGLGNHQGGEGFRGEGRQGLQGQVTAGGVEGHLHQFDVLLADDGARHGPVAGVQAARHQDAPGLAVSVGAYRHEDGLRQGRGPVVQGGVGDVQSGQGRHHGLEFVEDLQGALAGLGLIGGVGAVEFTPRDQLPDHGRDVVVIGAGADEAERLAVRPRPGRHQATDLHLRQGRGDALQLPRPQVRGNLVEEVINVLDPDDRQHGRHLVGGVGDERHGWRSG
jgi:hypothetical protein